LSSSPLLSAAVAVAEEAVLGNRMVSSLEEAAFRLLYGRSGLEGEYEGLDGCR
jgi:hypothetical protein